MTTPKEIVRVAALGDLHYPKIPQEILQGLLTQATEQADVLLLCGDLTDYGQPDEAQRLAQACATYAKIPTLGVLGNHDYADSRDPFSKPVGEVDLGKGTLLSDESVTLEHRLDGSAFLGRRFDQR